jgi:hypothetical protein
MSSVVCLFVFWFVADSLAVHPRCGSCDAISHIQSLFKKKNRYHCFGGILK